MARAVYIGAMSERVSRRTAIRAAGASLAVPLFGQIGRLLAVDGVGQRSVLTEPIGDVVDGRFAGQRCPAEALSGKLAWSEAVFWLPPRHARAGDRSRHRRPRQSRRTRSPAEAHRRRLHSNRQQGSSRIHLLVQQDARRVGAAGHHEGFRPWMAERHEEARIAAALPLFRPVRQACRREAS